MNLGSNYHTDASRQCPRAADFPSERVFSTGSDACASSGRPTECKTKQKARDNLVDFIT